MKFPLLLSICVSAPLFFACEKPAPVDTENHQQESEDLKVRLEQLSEELTEAKSEIKQLRENNNELTSRIVANEAKSSTLAKVIEVSATAHKAGSARASCILNIRNLQQAVRAHQNLQGFSVGDDLKWKDIIGLGKYIETMPTCPHDGEYILVNKIPTVGNAAAQCPHERKHNHRPESTQGW